MSKDHVIAEQRREVLDHRRRTKMASSAHAYVRGNTVKFYHWLAESDAAKALPAGPPIWICGDCHIGNLGPVADLKGHVEIEIRDLDQTVIGNPAHDLIRLGLSLAMAARGADLPGVITARMIEAMLKGYTSALARKPAEDPALNIGPMRRVLRDSLRRKWKHLAEERIEDVSPTIPLGSRFWGLEEQEREALRGLFAEDRSRDLLRCLDHRNPEVEVKLLDAAYWVKGCSSLGRLRFAALLRVGTKKQHCYRLMDVKEAIAPAAPATSGAEMPANNGERVVTGARALSPFLGNRMLAAQMLGRSVVIRELRPQDLKFECTGLSPEEALSTARLLASVVGRAHGRQLSVADRRAWIRTLGSRRKANIDAPSWLWTAVVDLVAGHEAAYLEHCRLYALAHAG